MRNLPQVIQAKALTDSVLRVAKQPGFSLSLSPEPSPHDRNQVKK